MVVFLSVRELKKINVLTNGGLLFSDGAGRSGTFCTIMSGVRQINEGAFTVDIPNLVKQLRCKRKFMVQDVDQLQYCYEAVLYHCQDILIKRKSYRVRCHYNAVNFLTNILGWVGLWGFLWWAPSAKGKDHHGVSSGWSSVWRRSNTGLSSTQYEQIPIILGVWPFCLTPFFFRSITFWRAYG